MLNFKTSMKHLDNPLKLVLYGIQGSKWSPTFYNTAKLIKNTLYETA